MPLAVEKIDISKLLGRCYNTMKPNKYNKSLESEFNTTTTTTTTVTTNNNNEHDLLNEGRSKIKRCGGD
jgi:hypothetical protein